jgi:hypothetical protein
MDLPFTTKQFLAVFEQYNEAVWPFQIILNLLALGCLILSIKRIRHSDKIIPGILTFFWLWIGIVYHLVFFSSINPAAKVFGVVNVLQGLVFLYFGVFKARLSFQFRTDVYGITGSLLILYALIAYPSLGYSLGHVYPKAPTFGLPCPTTIFTFGLLLWTSSRIPKVVLLVPIVWSMIGFSAALTMGMHEDIGLLVAAIITTALVVGRDKKALDAEGGAGHAA